MSAAVIGLIGGITGAVTGLLGGMIAGWQQRIAEAQRWRQDRANEVWKDERQSLSYLIRLIAVGSQAMAWLAWSAAVKPLETVKEEAERYDKRMVDLLPEIFGAQAAVASTLSDKTYQTIQAVVDHMIKLDTFLGTKCYELNSDPDIAQPIIADQHDVALGLAKEALAAVRGQYQSSN